MAANYISNVPKLKGRENYDEWAYAAENFLILEGIDITKEEPDDKAVLSAIDIQKAKAKLIMTIDSSLYVHIKTEKTVHAVWNKLKSLFDDSGFARKISLLRSLISVRLETSESMTVYITQVVDTAQKLRRTGFDISEEWVGSLLLAGLPEKFAPMIMAVEHSGINISSDVIKSKLLDMSAEIVSNESESAFLAKSWQHRHRKGGKVASTSCNETQSRSVNVKNNKTIKCYNCKEIGHFKNKCPLLLKQKTMNVFSVMFFSGKYNQEDWYIDSGASCHLVASEKQIINKSNNHTTTEIVVANQASVSVLCSGDTKITTIVNNKEHEITVKNVLCIPNLTANLLSVSQLIENGNKVSFQKGTCYIKNRQNELVGKAELVNGVYRLNVKSASLLAASAMTSGTDWHRRMGHLNSKDLNAMKNGAVEGLMYNDKADVSKLNCTVCCEGKQTRLPFPLSNNRSKAVLDVVHADVCGPMETKSIGLHRYFLLFVDDYSRMTFVYFLRNKSEVFKCFQEFRVMVEKQMNTNIKVLRSDNGLEFCSQDMQNYMKKCGIIHQRTTPYSPEQNGLCERFNRTVVEKARCLLFDAKLHKRFWAEAVHTAVYLKNRSVASGLNQKTPFELWTGRKPDVGHIRIFGSTVMAHVPKEKRKKWDKKAVRHLLLGYPDSTKGYRLYNPVTKKVVIARDVTIMEPKMEYNMEVAVEERVSTVDKCKQSEATNSDIAQVIIEEVLQTPLSPEQPSESIECTDTEQSLSTVYSDDSSYKGDDTTNSSSDEFFDSTLVNIEDVTQQDPAVPAAFPEKRIRKKPDRYGYSNICIQADTGICGDEVTLNEAMNGPESKQWSKAMEEELVSFKKNEAWEVVDKPEQGTVVQCKWVFRKKLDSDNNVRFRARLVAKGFTQKAGIDYNQTFSPVLRYSTLKLLFALTVKYDLEMTHLDVTTAFLNGHLNETVYMHLPTNFPCQDRINKVLKLNKAIYGLKQSARAWYERVDDCLQNIGYKRSMYEPCLFVKQNDKVRTYIALFVDDFFVYSNSPTETEYLKKELRSKFQLKDLGEIRQCLGMRVCKENNVITMDQTRFIEELLNKFNMEKCKHVNTPMEINLKLEKNDTCQIQYPYQQLIGSLLYLSILTRPDISYAVCYLSQFNNSYGETHWKHAKRVLKYLQCTKHVGLKYVKDNLDLIGYVDADWASNPLDRKSFTGYVFKMSGSVISHECRKQRTIALSSTEAEYMAICEASKEAMYLRNLLCELRCRNNAPVLIYNDNQSAQNLTENSSLHKRSKHIDVRYHFIRMAVEKLFVKVQYLNTLDMPADILTKSLCSIKHYKFVKQLGMAKI